MMTGQRRRKSGEKYFWDGAARHASPDRNQGDPHAQASVEASGAERAHLITALGNAALADNVPRVLAYEGDASPAVVIAALAALDRRSLGEADLAALAAVVASMPASCDARLVALLATRLDRGASVIEMLQIVAAREADDPDLSTRVASLLRSAGADMRRAAQP